MHAIRETKVAFDSSFDAKEQVRQAIDIVDLLGKYNLQLRRQGRGYVALCPWHDDTRPSLQVNPERQSWKCWPCDIGGDIFSFVMKMEGVDFPEALAMLADRAGIKLQKPARASRALDRVRAVRVAASTSERSTKRPPGSSGSITSASCTRPRPSRPGSIFKSAASSPESIEALSTRLRPAGSRLDPQAGRRQPRSGKGPGDDRRAAAALRRAAVFTICSAAADCSPFMMPKAGRWEWAGDCSRASRPFCRASTSTPGNPPLPQEPSAVWPRSGQGGDP